MTADNPGGLSGRAGWLVIGVIIVLALVVPGVLLVTTPQGMGSFGLYVAIAMVPAIAFGVFGVWTALRYGRQ